MATKLYPPQIEGILPAFYKTKRFISDTETAIEGTVTIPFGMNRAVSETEVSGMSLRLKTVSTNTRLLEIQTNIVDFDIGEATFTITDDVIGKFNEGQYYLAQVAYVDTNNLVGYYSTLGTIKCVAKPTVRIANFDATMTNSFKNEMIGEYIQNTEYGDSTEKVYSYEFNIWDLEDNLLLSSGEQIHNTSEDVSSYISTDKFVTGSLIKEDTIYYISYKVTTLNKLIISSPKYKIMANKSIEMEASTLMLHAENNYDEGYIRVYLGDSQVPETPISGTYMISRGSTIDNYFEWNELTRFKVDGVLPSRIEFNDYTVEQGQEYKYRIQQYNIHGVYSYPVMLSYSENSGGKYGQECSIIADFEDMFLYDGERQLKVRFDPKVSSFKNDIPEQKMDTIGAKYPYIFRNGHVKYKEFPVAGLISFQMDLDNLFLIDDEVRQAGVLQESYIRDTKEKSLIYEGDMVRRDTDLTSENIYSERYFKLKVLDWLSDGEVKLFRSPNEGNYLVRLLNVSMTPNDTLGRMLHSFTCTAYEIADLTYDNLVTYNIVRPSTPTVLETHWGQVSGKDFLKDKPTADGFYKITTESVVSTGFVASNFAPGDIIRILYPGSNTPVDIVIGVTGYYEYQNDERQIADVWIKPNPNVPISAFSRDFTYNYEGLSLHAFDAISDINSFTQVAQTFYGPQENLLEPIVLSDKLSIDDLHNHINFNVSQTTNKVGLLNLDILHVRRRPLVPVYLQTDFSFWTDLKQSCRDWDSKIKYTLTSFGVVTEPFTNYDFGYTPEATSFPISDIKCKYNTANATITFPNNLNEDDVKVLETLKQDKTEYCLYDLYIPEFSKNINRKKDPRSDLVGTDGIGTTTLIGWKRLNLIYDTKNGAWYTEYQPYFSLNTTRDGEVIDYKSVDNYGQYTIDGTVSAEGTEIIYVNDELTLKNLGIPERVLLGNGVIAELTCQLQVVSFAIEQSDDTLKAKRLAYLAAKTARDDDIDLYYKKSFDYIKELETLDALETSLAEHTEVLEDYKKKSADAEELRNKITGSLSDYKKQIIFAENDLLEQADNYFMKSEPIIWNAKSSNVFSFYKDYLDKRKSIFNFNNDKRGSVARTFPISADNANYQIYTDLLNSTSTYSLDYFIYEPAYLSKVRTMLQYLGIEETISDAIGDGPWKNYHYLAERGEDNYKLVIEEKEYAFKQADAEIQYSIQKDNFANYLVATKALIGLEDFPTGKGTMGQFKEYLKKKIHKAVYEDKKTFSDSTISSVYDLLHFVGVEDTEADMAKKICLDDGTLGGMFTLETFNEISNYKTIDEVGIIQSSKKAYGFKHPNWSKKAGKLVEAKDDMYILIPKFFTLKEGEASLRTELDEVEQKITENGAEKTLESYDKKIEQVTKEIEQWESVIQQVDYVFANNSEPDNADELIKLRTTAAGQKKLREDDLATYKSEVDAFKQQQIYKNYLTFLNQKTQLQNTLNENEKLRTQLAEDYKEKYDIFEEYKKYYLKMVEKKSSSAGITMLYGIYKEVPNGSTALDYDNIKTKVAVEDQNYKAIIKLLKDTSAEIQNYIVISGNTEALKEQLDTLIAQYNGKNGLISTMYRTMQEESSKIAKLKELRNVVTIDATFDDAEKIATIEKALQAYWRELRTVYAREIEGRYGVV